MSTPTTEPSTVLETVSLVEGLTKEILRVGEGDATPSSGDEVRAHYTGRLASDGTIFDSSVSRGQPFKVRAAVSGARAASGVPPPRAYS